MLNLQIIVIIIKSVLIKNHDHCYYEACVETFLMYKMLYYERIDVSEGIDVNKTSASKECIVCHYSHFLYKGFTF